MTALAAKRRHPAAFALLLLFALLVTGTAYAAFAPRPAQAATLGADQVAEGKKLFQANCSTCHGLNAEGRATGDGTKAGPALAGVGAAAVDFQMGTGRMPLAGPGIQAQRKQKILFTPEQIAQIAAYIASLAPGPAVPSGADYDPASGNAGKGGSLFRVNCAMCHNAVGAGGALTRGKYAPSLIGVASKDVYEAMVTGPQSMPVFNDTNIDPQGKRDIIAYLQSIHTAPSPGGNQLGSLGPVTEGLFAWVFGLGILVGCAVWLGQKSA
ncbi:MAG: c-type cytochrome [Nostocoides sp.]